MLDIPMPEIRLDGSRIATIVGQMEPTSMPEHMWMNPELTETSSLRSSA
jgi:hypothetical protein